MKYSPLEMYEYCREHKLLNDLMEASYNNTHGFQHYAATGHLFRKPDGFYAKLDGYQGDFVANLTEEEYRQVTEGKCSYEMELCFAQVDGKQCYFLLVAAGTEGESQTTLEKALAKELLIRFLQFAGVDTLYKLNCVLSEAEYLLRESLEW